MISVIVLLQHNYNKASWDIDLSIFISNVTPGLRNAAQTLPSPITL